MYDELVAWLRSWSELPAHCECYKSCDECDKQDLCSTFTNESIITKAGEAADAIEELSAIREEQKAQIIAMTAEIEEQKPRWIPVTERLPKESERVLTACEDGVSFGFFEEIIADDEFVKEWHDMMYYPISVTHWMPLPQPPKEG